VRPIVSRVARRPYLLPGLALRALARQRRRRRDLVTARAILPVIPPQRGAPPPTSWRIRRVEWPKFSSMGVTVVLVGPPGQRPRAVVKLPHTPEGVASLRRQAGALATLRADPRVRQWRSLVAETLGEGHIGEQFYMIETALPGRAPRLASLDPATRERLQASAAAAIGGLHTSIARVGAVDAGRLARWVDAPVAVIAGVVAPLPAAARHRAALQRLRAELHGALAGRSVATSWIHGDYWLGNVLVGGDGSKVVGIVDWERAAPDELPLHDLMHLLLFTRQQAHLWDEADIIAALTGAIRWTPPERALLEQARAALPGHIIEERPMTLLYWLRHLAATLTLLPEYASDRAYLTGHIECVLQCL
jgi:aminoglycoside phosphotransferase (APT) family kinase protein